LACSSELLVARKPVCYKASEATHRDRQDGEIGEEGLPTTSEDEALVTRAQEGEHWAFEKLVRRYQQKAYAIAYHMCSGDPEEAKDLVQEAFLRAYRNVGKFKGDSSFYTWLYRIIVNSCLDGRRRQRRWERLLSRRRPAKGEEESSHETIEEKPHAGEVDTPLAVLSSKQLSGEIRKALMSLPDRQRLAFQLKVLHGMSIREIAQVMEAAEGTVKSHLFRATHFLREALKEWTHA
jgi:RNA polymerase sigma-70 factor (ECF subfamily)